MGPDDSIHPPLEEGGYQQGRLPEFFGGGISGNREPAEKTRLSPDSAWLLKIIAL
jgi:hypothetical protein